MRAVREELHQPVFGLRDSIRPRDADGIEAERACRTDQRGFERCAVF
jgi:hypothetical protein